MKKIVTGLVIFLLCFSVYSQKGNSIVQLKGALKNFSNQVEVEDMSDLQYLLPPTSERMIVPDSSGHFSISFPVASPNYFRLGRNILYLSPGDNMEIFVDKMTLDWLLLKVKEVSPTFICEIRLSPRAALLWKQADRLKKFRKPRLIPSCRSRLLKRKNSMQ